MNSFLLSLLFCASLALSGCGAGIRIGVGDDATGANRLVLSGTNGITVRKNNCYSATISAVDAFGAPLAVQSTNVTVTGSNGLRTYATEQGCQTYDGADEKSFFVLTSDSSSATFYVRPDATGESLLSASASSGFESATVSIPVSHTAFDQSDGPSAAVSAIIVDSIDGSTYLGGSFVTYDNSKVNRIARLNSAGTLDTTFAPTGGGLNGMVSAIALQADRKLVVGGAFTSYNGTSVPRIARLNSDGSLDTGFGPTGTGLNGTVSTIAIQADGKIIVGGAFTSYNGTSRPYIARLNSDGSLDPSFATSGTGLSMSVRAVALQSNGKILVGGLFLSYNGTSRPYIARLEADGTLDGSFSTTGTGLDGYVHAISVRLDGKIVIGGAFYAYDVTNVAFIAMLNSDGSLDSSFVPTGTGLDEAVNSLAIQSDDKVIAGGVFLDYDGVSAPFVIRLNSNGSRDSSFDVGTGFDGEVYSVALQSDGRLVAGGIFVSYNGAARPYLARLSSSGSLETSYASSGFGFNDEIKELALQNDGKVLVGGLFTDFGGSSQPYVSRLNTDGTLDTSFAQVGTGVGGYSIDGIAVQSDGKIVVGGNFISYNGVSRPYVARLNSSGSLDTGFATTGTGLSANVNAVAIQSDGKILVAGSFISYNGSSRRRIARLNSDGSLDATLSQTGTGLDGYVSELIVQSDGKILVGGAFTSYNGTTRNYVARLNSNGTLDATFAPTGTGLNGIVFAMSLQSDGKVLVGGAFTSYNGTARKYVARLNSDGTLDTSFVHSGTGLDNLVQELVLQSNGMVLVVGDFTTYNGTSVPYLARLNSDGSLDSTFAPSGEGLDSSVNALVIQDDAKLVIGGRFSRCDSSTANRVARLTYIDTLD